LIFVNELDVYLRAFYYWINFDMYSQNFALSDELKAWKNFLDKSQSLFKKIEDSADEFGFRHGLGKAKGMSGEKEVATQRMNFYLPFDGLRIYPRLLYSEGYLPKLGDFETHRYYFTYHPKVLMPIFTKLADRSWETTLSQHWTIGSHTYVAERKEHWIAYNVSAQVNLRTIIEEELHCLSEEVHGTTKTDDVLNAIRAKDPTLEKEIGLNLDHILSAEEERFRAFGNLMDNEMFPEIRKLQSFCNLFEETLIVKGKKVK
jgi:hypothetical protein